MSKLNFKFSVGFDFLFFAIKMYISNYTIELEN